MNSATDRAWQQFLDVLTGHAPSACCPTLEELAMESEMKPTPDLFAEYRERVHVPKHARSCPACAGSAFCACDNTILARHAWANKVTRAACLVYLRAGEAAYDQVITNAKAAEES